MTITHQTVLGEDGKPSAALIPWDVFERLCEALDNDDTTATPEEAEAIAEAESDRAAGNNEAFTDLSDLKAEFAG